MHQQIKNKLQGQYLQLQKQKLNDDPFYQALLDKCMTVLKYTVPVISVMNGFATQEIPESYTWVKAQLDDYVKTMYPLLTPYGNEKELPPPYTYPKERFMKPWDYADIIEPYSLTLHQIDLRLTIFKEYLAYRLTKYNHVSEVIDTYNRTGIMFYRAEDETLEFDEWLYLENYDQLVRINWNQY